MAAQSQCARSERRQVSACLRALPVSGKAVVDIFSKKKKMQKNEQLFFNFKAYYLPCPIQYILMRKYNNTYESAMPQCTLTRVSMGTTINTEPRIMHGTIVIGPINRRSNPINPEAPRRACIAPPIIRLPES